jgi:hypothetical protein
MKTDHPQYGDLFSYETNEPLAESIEEIVEDAIDLVALLDSQATMDGVEISPNDTYRVRIFFTNYELYEQAVTYFEAKYTYEVVDLNYRFTERELDFIHGTYESPSGLRLSMQYDRPL